MNSQLGPVFDTFLPVLENAEIYYSVYGGASIAAYAGKFVRYNSDVDVFVRELDFEKTKNALFNICEKIGGGCICKIKMRGERPKAIVYIDNQERMSVVPVYEKNGSIKFKYSTDNDEMYSMEILERVERKIGGFRFFTPRNEFIKEKFINHMKSQPKKMQREEYQVDAKALLSAEELDNLGLSIR